MCVCHFFFVSFRGTRLLQYQWHQESLKNIAQSNFRFNIKCEPTKRCKGRDSKKAMAQLQRQWHIILASGFNFLLNCVVTATANINTKKKKKKKKQQPEVQRVYQGRTDNKSPTGLNEAVRVATLFLNIYLMERKWQQSGRLFPIYPSLQPKLVGIEKDTT